MTKAKAKELDSKTLILQHYKEDADGLCTALGDPLAREGGAAYSVDKTAFIESGWTIKREEITVSDSVSIGDVLIFTDDVLQLQEKIGKGEFGDVRLGTYGSRKVAVKELHKDTSMATNKFLTEAKVMT